MRLNEVVPWGHNLPEYKAMFNLDNADIRKSLVGFADGTSSANSELAKQGGSMVSIDPIYQFSNHDINRRLNEVTEQSKIYTERLSPEERQEANEIAYLR